VQVAVGSSIVKQLQQAGAKCDRVVADSDGSFYGLGELAMTDEYLCDLQGQLLSLCSMCGFWSSLEEQQADKR